MAGPVLQGCAKEPETGDGAAENAAFESISISGTLVDSWCYPRLTKAERTSDTLRIDESCAEYSLKNGFPLVVVVDTAERWILSESPKLLHKAFNRRVRVTGDIRSQGVLIPRKVSARIGGAWTTLLDPESTFEVTGRVTGTTAERDMLIVKHDEIEGYMGAMTMPFIVPDSNLIDGIAPGDSIRFTIQVADGDPVLTSVNFVAVDTRR